MVNTRRVSSGEVQFSQTVAKLKLDSMASRYDFVRSIFNFFTTCGFPDTSMASCKFYGGFKSVIFILSTKNPGKKNLAVLDTRINECLEKLIDKCGSVVNVMDFDRSSNRSDVCFRMEWTFVSPYKMK